MAELDTAPSGGLALAPSLHTDGVLLVPAGTTYTAPLGVNAVVGMASGTCDLQAIPEWNGIPAKGVGFRRDRFQMGRADAFSNTTEMVDLQAVWDRPVGKRIGEAMAEALAPAEPHLCVATSGKATAPQPAGVSNFDSGDECFNFTSGVLHVRHLVGVGREDTPHVSISKKGIR